MRAFLHFVCVPLCLVWSSEGWKEAFATVRKSDGDSRKDVVFLTFDERTWGDTEFVFGACFSSVRPS